jgi:hypothetical protein
MMILARVDGKPPLEYLQARAKEFLRNLVHRPLPAETFTQSEINNSWKSEMKKRYKV